MTTTGILIVVLGVVFLVCIIALFAIDKLSSRENSTPRETCEHNWIPHYDPAEAARIYNDGFNAVTDRYICTKCGNKKKGKKILVD